MLAAANCSTALLEIDRALYATRAGMSADQVCLGGWWRARIVGGACALVPVTVEVNMDVGADLVCTIGALLSGGFCRRRLRAGRNDSLFMCLHLIGVAAMLRLLQEKLLFQDGCSGSSVYTSCETLEFGLFSLGSRGVLHLYANLVLDMLEQAETSPEGLGEPQEVRTCD